MSNDGEFQPCKCGNSDIEVHRSGKIYVCRCTKCCKQVEYEVKKNCNLFDVFENLIDQWNTSTTEAEAK